MTEAVFARLQALRERREELVEISSTPAILEHLTKADLEELRHLLRPPLPVRQCLEVVYVALHVEKVAGDIERLALGKRLDIPWSAVQTMLARFDSFFPMMERYDIAGLTEHPKVAQYLSSTYFHEGGLTYERVLKSSKASAGLFQWCSHSLARVEAALELVSVRAEELAIAAELPRRWMCKTDTGWKDFPAAIDGRLTVAEPSTSGVVEFRLGGESYSVNLIARTQRNVLTGMLRPIRPPGDEVDLRAMQGSWQASWGGLIVVRGTQVAVHGEWVGPELEMGPDGAVHWNYRGTWVVVGGNPTHVEWALEGSDDVGVTWEAIAEGGARLNDDGAPVRLSTADGFQTTFYCGRRLGAQAIPGSNGQCGPSNGPQCASCGRYQIQADLEGGTAGPAG